MNINAGGSNPLSLVFHDAKGNVIAAPAGTSIAWNVEDSIEGKHSGTIDVSAENGLTATLTSGDLGAEGVVTATVTFPDGTQIKGASAPITVVEAMPASVEVEIGGTPESEVVHPDPE